MGTDIALRLAWISWALVSRLFCFVDGRCWFFPVAQPGVDHKFCLALEPGGNVSGGGLADDHAGLADVRICQYSTIT